MARMLCNVFVVLATVLVCQSVSAAKITPVTGSGTGVATYTGGAGGLSIGRGLPILAGVEPSGGIRLGTTITQTHGWPKVGNSLKSIVRGSPQALIGTLALAYLLEKLPGASIGENGGLQRAPNVSTDPLYTWDRQEVAGVDNYSSADAACRGFKSGLLPYESWQNVFTSSTRMQCRILDGSTGYYNHQGYAVRSSTNCQYGHNGSQCYQLPPLPEPFTEPDYDDLVSHVPSIPNDYWNDLGPAMDNIPGTFDDPDSVDLSGPSSVSGPTTTTTTTDATGNTTVTESTPTYNFDYSSNPLSITSTTTTVTNTYTNGQPTGTTTTTTGPTPSPVEQTGGGGAPAAEVPTDCAFMPTVCEFIDWVKTPFDPEEVDFAELIEDKDFSKSVTIAGNASCPAPLVMSTSKGTFEFSWEPACTFAEMLKPLFLIAALIGAMYITIGIGRSD